MQAKALWLPDADTANTDDVPDSPTVKAPDPPQGVASIGDTSTADARPATMARPPQASLLTKLLTRRSVQIRTCITNSGALVHDCARNRSMLMPAPRRANSLNGGTPANLLLPLCLPFPPLTEPAAGRALPADGAEGVDEGCSQDPNCITDDIVSSQWSHSALL
jgi:hypothetical protein